MTNMSFQQFIDEFNRLKNKFPRSLNHNTLCENSDFGDYLARCKNSFYSFDNADSQDNIYVFDSYKVTNSADCDYIVECEKCYEGVDLLKTYNSTYMRYCARIYDSHFCYDCNDSNKLFGCAYLNFKQYCIFNRQYTKEDYEKKVTELLKKSPEENLNQMKKIMMKFPVSITHISHSENCDYGNHIHYSKNLYLCFDSAHSEDSGYLYDSHYNKYCYDLTQSFHCEFCYECVNSDKLNNCYYMNDCSHIFDSGFCENCTNSNHLFGCFGLIKQDYCILNKKYSKEEYVKIIKEIIESYKRLQPNS